MKNVTSKQIINRANKLVANDDKWHFHILVPGCTFNKDKKYALILEDSTNQKQFVNLSFKKQAKTGKKLVEMLHGKGISKDKSPFVKDSSKLSPRVMKMIERAKELNIKGFSWHHHLLFPDCIFNKDPRYWMLVFEDPVNGEIIKDVSKEEPRVALKLIEPLFYKQKG